MNSNERKPLPNLMFKVLHEDEQIVYRDWARKNYIAGDSINVCWHPIVRAECGRINAEQCMR